MHRLGIGTADLGRNDEQSAPDRASLWEPNLSKMVTIGNRRNVRRIR